MKVAIIGYGKEGQAAEKYFETHGDTVKVISPYDNADYDKYDFSQYDLVLRSPSVPPRPEFSSMTRYFFEHCQAPIIGVTGTKGKGTTCTMIRDLLQAIGMKPALVGNIGVPCIDYLDNSDNYDVIVFEISSFQLWDIEKSPQVAVVLRIEPDHLNVHKDFADYVAAKGHIAEYQGASDKVVYFRENKYSCEIAEKSVGEKIPYPVVPRTPELEEVLDALQVPGAHNREDAEAALLAVAAFLDVDLAELLRAHGAELAQALHDFQGLPHHIEPVRELNGVSYYDDSFSTTEPSLEVALKAFAGRPIVLIAGGQDKGIDLAPIKKLIFDEPGVEKAFLIGEIAENLAEGEPEEKYEIVGSLEEAVKGARKVAEGLVGEKKDSRDDNNVGPVVLLSPAAASLDMFKSYYERGDLFKKAVKNLK